MASIEFSLLTKVLQWKLLASVSISIAVFHLNGVTLSRERSLITSQQIPTFSALSPLRPIQPKNLSTSEDRD